jgi:glutamate 5-kinase
LTFDRLNSRIKQLLFFVQSKKEMFVKTKESTIVIKLGSALLTDGEGKINNEFIAEVCWQVFYLMHKGHRIVIVTSGAVASDEHKNRSKNLRAAIGQGKLLNVYADFFKGYNLEIAQLLLTDDQLLAGRTAVTEKVIREAFQENVVCIINANDVIDSEEIEALKHCADNDILSGLVCRLLNADVLIIAFNEEGIINEKNAIIHEVRKNDLDRVLSLAKGSNHLGHGKNGMKTKIKTLAELASSGTTAILAPGKQKNFIIRAFQNEPNFGTRFIAE